MLAGAALEAVAAQLMEAFRERGAPFEGVIFHGETGWHVMNRAGFCESALTSPIKDHEAFVIFDEARCRCARAVPCQQRSCSSNGGHKNHNSLGVLCGDSQGLAFAVLFLCVFNLEACHGCNKTLCRSGLPNIGGARVVWSSGLRLP